MSAKLRTLAPYALLLIATLLAYANVYDNQFVFDDEFLIQKNQFIRNWDYFGTLFVTSSTAGFGGLDAFYRPLQLALYTVIFHLFDLSNWAYHLLNLLLHIANACLIFALGRRLKFRADGALCAALLWALHPIHTEAVTYMSATADPLYAFFCLLGVIVLLPAFSPRRVMMATVCYAFGLLSKETAIVFPLLALATFALAAPERKQWRSYLRFWPLAVIGALYLLWRTNFVQLDTTPFYKYGGVYSDSIFVRILTFFATIPSYLRVFFWPNDLHMDRGFSAYASLTDGPVLSGLALSALALAQIIFLRGKEYHPIKWGLVWAAAAHLLHSGIIMPVNAVFLEHWLYLPSVGLMLGYGKFFSNRLAKARMPWRVCIGTIAGFIGVVLAVLTWQQNRVWATPISFYENILSYGEKSSRVHNNLAMAYEANGDMPRAITNYRAAIALNDTFPQSHHNLALALLKQPDFVSHMDEAERELKRAIELNPDFFQSYDSLARMYQYVGDRDRAESYRRKEEEIMHRLFAPK